MVTSSSTYFEVALETPVVPSTTDLAAWTDITLPASISTYEDAWSVGVFSYDLTDFFANCVTASTNCNSTDYNADYFDGWAIGAYAPVNTTFEDAA
jgi:hypothetical protein